MYICIVLVEVCQYYRAVGAPVTIHREYSYLEKVFSKNKFPCLQCKKSKSKAKKAADHMNDENHWMWTAEHPSAGGEVGLLSYHRQIQKCSQKVMVKNG